MTSTTSKRRALAAVQRPRLPALASGQSADLSKAKDEARRSLGPGDAGRELVLALPDRMDSGELDALFPTLVRMLRDRSRTTEP